MYRGVRNYLSGTKEMNTVFIEVPDIIRRKLHAVMDGVDIKDIVAHEPQLHCTVLCGLNTTNVFEVAQRVNFEPFILSYGSVSCFTASDTRQSDVLKVDVTGSGLRELRTNLEILPHKPSFVEYSPHVTLSYIRPYTGLAYIGSEINEEHLVTQVVFATDTEQYVLTHKGEIIERRTCIRAKIEPSYCGSL